MILLTGHKGFIGSKLFQELQNSGHDAVGVDLKDGLDISHCLPDIDVDYVFHMAALPSVSFSIANPSYSLKHNVLATSVLLEWAKSHGAKCVVFSSSAAVYGDGSGPKSPYGLHKMMSELECGLYSELYGLKTVCLRYFNVYSEDQKYGGPYSTVISAWMEMIRQNRQLRIDGDGTQTRDFIHVDDVISANMWCIDNYELLNEPYYDVGSGRQISLNYIRNFINKRYDVDWLERPSRDGDVQDSKIGHRALQNSGWLPKINIEDGLERCFSSILCQNNT